jgi:two-component system NarL family response regulator
MKWIRSSGSNARTVILTAFRSKSDVSQAIQAGAHAYLLKDASVDEILKTIRRVHQGKTAVTEEQQLREPRHSEDSTGFQPLELDILALIAQGRDNRTIGSQLGLSTDAVKYRLRGLFSKLGVRKRAAAARAAIERGLLGTCY